MNICVKFIEWLKLLLVNTCAVVNLNNNPDGNFKIERGVRQGCSLAPYLFLSVGEILAYIIRKAVAEGRLKGVYLSGGKK